MNKRMIFKVIGRILLLEAGLMILPVLVGLYYGEEFKNIAAFLIVIFMLLVFGGLLNLSKIRVKLFFAREGLVIVSLSWILLSFFGGLPLYFSGQFPSIIDAFFEISSGFTTTGSTVCTNIEGLSYSILFWRSFTHLIGGMGVLVFALAIIPQMKEDSVYLMKAEVPGPIFGKLVSKMGDTARLLYKIYLALTGVLIITLCIAGMPLFDSMVNAFATAGTGGFSIKNSSIAFYNSATIEAILGIGMLVFGVNFNLYYLFLIKRGRDVFKSEELRWYLGIVFISIILISLNVYHMFPSAANTFRNVFFTVSSIITTTGFSTVDFAAWPVFSHVILLTLMFIGACAGSTAGGIKVSRIVTYVKSGIGEIKKTRNPKEVVNITFEGKIIESRVARSIASYLMLYVLVFLLQFLIISLDINNFEDAFSAVAATFNNIGPGLGQVGPLGSFKDLSDLSKLVLSFGMIAGRLEILPILVLFSPRTWQKT